MRRSWRLLPLLAALALLSACGAAQQGSVGKSSFAWRQFQGTTLRVLLSETHWQQFITPHLPEFEQLTGIKLATEVYPQGKLWDLLETGLKDPGRVDVFMTLPALDGVRYYRMGAVLPVNHLLADRNLTAPDYHWEDFFPRAQAAMQVEGALLGPPVMGEHLALLYRKDVFKQYQVAVPKTLDELEAAARLLHGKPMGPGGAPGVGIVSRGKGVSATSIYAAYLHALGGTWMNGAHRSTINGPQSLEALGRLGRLLGSYGPPNVSTFEWQEASSLFMDGRAAIYIEGSSIFPLLEQSSQSRVADKVGYAIFPAGPGGPGTSIAVRGLAIAKGSANPGAAWLFLQWASSPDLVRSALVSDILVGRQSAWKDKYYWDGMPPDLVQSFQEAARVGAPDWAPPMVSVASAREILGQVIETAIRGGDYRAAAGLAEARLSEVLRKTENLPAAPKTSPSPGRAAALK